MPDAQPAAEAVSSAPASLPSLFELIESVADEQANAAPTAAPATVAPGAKPAPAGFVDPLDETNFTAEKLATPEGIQAARDLLQAQVKEALGIRRAAHNARAEAERKEARLRQTKSSVLGEKQLMISWQQQQARDRHDMESGDPELFIPAVARLANISEDKAREYWNDKIAMSLAKGKRVETESNSSKEVEALRAELRAERKAQEDAYVAQQEEQQIMQLRVAQINEARTFTDMPYVHLLAMDDAQVALVDARLTDIRTQHFNKTGTPLDIRSASNILETEIRSHFELLQRAGNPNGALNGERVVAAPVAGLAGKPELTAKPELAQRPPIQAVAAIPSALTAAPAATKRVLTEAEARDAKVAELDKLGLFSNFGM